MIIELHRVHRTPWGVDGTLHISGEKVADTTEHPTIHLPAGIYTITLDNYPFSKCNGVMTNAHREINVGEHQCSGLVIHTKKVWQSLYDRIQKALKRGTKVTLVIEDPTGRKSSPCSGSNQTG